MVELMDHETIVDIALARMEFGCHLCEFEGTNDSACNECNDVSESEAMDQQDREDALRGYL